jgi:hypothetical protein
MPRLMRVWNLLLLQVSGVEQDQPGEFAGGARRDDFAVKPALAQQRQPAAMIEMGMRQQHKVDAGGIETKVGGIIEGKLAAALVESAVDQNAPAGALDEVA